MKDLFLEKLEICFKEKKISKKIFNIIKEFYISYSKVCKDKKKSLSIFSVFLKLAIKQIKSPYQFDHYHKKIRKPFDYYNFGISFLEPLIKLESSKLLGIENLKKIKKQLQKKENVFLLANHQSECDPQAISILLKKNFPEIAKKIIYVAGERVLKDPLAIPFSMGCDLFCIYSKKYINNPIHLKRQKHLYNKKTLDIMNSLLKKGGKIIYIAPSGGRDRPNKKGIVEIAHFDPHSIELIYLISKKAKTKTHFYPLSLFTYDILPPPDTTQEEMGEKRITKGGKIHANFSSEIDMENFEPFDKITNDKIIKRKKRAEYIEKQVSQGYKILRSL